MMPAVGSRDQIRAHLHVLRRLSDIAKKLEKKIRDGYLPEDPVEAVIDCDILSAYPFLEICYDRRTPELIIDDDTMGGIPLDQRDPVGSLLHLCAAFILPRNDEEIIAMECSWLEALAARHEKAIRQAVGNIVETDGLTAWALALEAARERDIDHDLLRQEIQASVAERRMPQGIAAELISKGWHMRRHHQEPNIAHWDHPTGQSGRVLAKITFRPETLYEGQGVTSNIHFSSRAHLQGAMLTLRSARLPSALVASLEGKSLEELIDEKRLHGWNLKIDRLASSEDGSSSSGDETNLILETNRHDAGCRMCFKA